MERGKSKIKRGIISVGYNTYRTLYLVNKLGEATPKEILNKLNLEDSYSYLHKGIADGLLSKRIFDGDTYYKLTKNGKKQLEVAHNLIVTPNEDRKICIKEIEAEIDNLK